MGSSAGVGDSRAPLSAAEHRALSSFAAGRSGRLNASERAALTRVIDPIEGTLGNCGVADPSAARSVILRATHSFGCPWWSWDEDRWTAVLEDRAQQAANDAGCGRHDRLCIFALAYLLGDQRRLHRRAGVVQLRKLADLVFGVNAARPALEEVLATLSSWHTSTKSVAYQVSNATLDLLLTCGSPRLEDVTEKALVGLVAEYEVHQSRRKGLFKVSRVLAHKGLIAAPVNSNLSHGPYPETLASVPPEWSAMALRWRRLATQEAGTVRGMFSSILIAGRWAAEVHPEAAAPEAWTRDIAAEYVADTMSARVGQWAGSDRNHARLGQALTASGKATRMDGLRRYFMDLIEWEWIKPRFDPRRVLSLPLSVRAQIGPNPRIIDDVTWAKLMGAGLSLNVEDLNPYGTPAARQAGPVATFYPIEMVRTVVGVWLFAGCRIDEIRRLAVDCTRWDEGTDEATGEAFPICLLHVPQNKTSRPFSKPVDPIVGQLIDAWRSVRPPQPLLEDPKTGERRQVLFCYRGQGMGSAYLNATVIPALCRKAGVPEDDSRGALTSHRARATIATQLLNAPEPLSLPDLQAWLGHKHPSSTRHYAAILQRKLTAAYRKADYFARNVRTIQVLIDRDAILSGAAAGGQPWKHYDLGAGYCTYDFFAKCPHRMACARCPFYLPKASGGGQLLAVRDGIETMLERVDLTDDERAALEGDRDAVAALAARLVDLPTPAGPTPRELGTDRELIPLTVLMDPPVPRVAVADPRKAEQS